LSKSTLEMFAQIRQQLLLKLSHEMKIDLTFEIICQDALEMLTQIRQQLNSSIHSRSWMDGATKIKAVAKLDHMFLEVGDLCVRESE